jgi:betaine-homocysteine S-methyltransferase
MKSIRELLVQGPVIGDGGYLIELERRGYVDSGSGREQVGTGRGSGQFTPEVAIEHPDALRELHREFLHAGSQVLQALTFFGTREKLSRAGYGAQTEEINFAAVKLAKEVAGDRALVAGSVSRTQLVEREGMGSLSTARAHIAEQIRLLKAAGVDFLILETFFHLAEMEVALAAAADSGLAAVATMSFRPLVTHCSDGYTPAECARVMADLGAVAVGANCEQDPGRMITLLREMRDAANVAVAAQPSAFRTTDTCHSFTRLPEFPDALETIQIPRVEFVEFGRVARNEGIRYVGGCCGCNAAYIRSLADGVATAK